VSAPGPIARFLTDDHVRLDGLLRRAFADPDNIDDASYAEFRAGLLRHIGMEEKILLPAAQSANGGKALAASATLRRHHGALAALLVPAPTPTVAAAIRAILAAHNALEEGPGGVYESCERLVGSQGPRLLARLRGTPEVPLNPHVNGPGVRDAMRRAVARAGFDPDALGL